MTEAWRDDDFVRILREAKVVAVVGLSNDRFRPSFGVARYLQQEGYRIIPVNPHEAEVLGEKAYPDLLHVPDHIDVVDVFRRPQFVPEIVGQAAKIGAETVWLQLGVGSPTTARLAQSLGLKVVLNRCMAVEARRLHELVPE